MTEQVQEVMSEIDKHHSKVIAVSGGFDPIHDGHVSMLREASAYGLVYVIMNSDDFLKRKKGFVFMPHEARKAILQAIRYVFAVVECIDTDQTVCRTLEAIRPDYFANGGDRSVRKCVPEAEVCDRLGIKMLYGVGGREKVRSSSDLIKEFQKRNINEPVLGKQS